MCLQSVEQVAFADVILLNKSDLVTSDDKKRITARIKVLCCVSICSLYALCAVNLTKSMHCKMESALRLTQRNDSCPHFLLFEA